MEWSEQIYEHLMDEESKELYKLRLKYSQTKDYSHICRLVARTREAASIRKQAASFPQSPIFLWGTGFWGGYLRKTFPDIPWAGYVDNTLREKEKDGLPVFCAEEFRHQYQDAVIVIATVFWHREIRDQLLSWGYASDRIINAGKMMEELFDRQYFDLPALPHEKEEVFVDAGCFDGLSVRNFIRWCGGDYKEVLAFEPDGQCFKRCRDCLKDVRGLTLAERGLWSREETLSFHATGSSDSSISQEGEVLVRTVRLDDFLGDKRITFLKMDIEGAEKEALLGAARTIRRDKPKLAVSIYHKPEDIRELPELILNIRNDYRFYLRHYSLRDAETVLYGI